MLIKPDCIPCILRMTISLARKLSLTEENLKALYSDILELPELRGKRWDITSPEIIEKVMIRINDAVGNPDPFATEKRRLNTTLLDRYSIYRNLVDRSGDPLNTAVKLALGGNAIDFMVPDATVGVVTDLEKHLESSLPHEQYSQLNDKLKSSKLLVYFGDNAGEIVLDKLLIETINRLYDSKIIFVVRSVPTLNDVTLRDATFVGLDKVARIVENGIDGPLPGTVLKRCSEKVRDAVQRADLIISKGGGNYDSLGEEKEFLDKIVFMFLSKCFPYNQEFGVDLFQPILAL